jgi:hypothetical protein
LKAIRENVLEPHQRALRPPQDAIDELWQAAGEGRIKATAIEYKNAKAIVGDLIEIPTHYWARLKPVDDPLSGKAMLSDDQGRVYRDVQFPRLDGKKIWPKSPPLSGEPLIEPGAVEVLPEPPEPERVEAPEPTRPAEPELLESKAWLDDMRKKHPRKKNELLGTYASRLHTLMQEAHVTKHVTKLWPLKTLLRRLYDK